MKIFEAVIDFFMPMLFEWVFTLPDWMSGLFSRRRERRLLRRSEVRCWLEIRAEHNRQWRWRRGWAQLSRGRLEFRTLDVRVQGVDIAISKDTDPEAAHFERDSVRHRLHLSNGSTAVLEVPERQSDVVLSLLGFAPDGAPLPTAGD